MNTQTGLALKLLETNHLGTNDLATTAQLRCQKGGKFKATPIFKQKNVILRRQLNFLSTSRRFSPEFNNGMTSR